MSDSFPKQRGFPGGLDLRGREGNPTPADMSDPLAELARLVGREDPFRDLFPARESVKNTARPERPNGPPMLPPPEPFERFPAPSQPRDAGARFADETDHPARGTYEPPFDTTAGEHDESLFHAPLGQGRRDLFSLPMMSGEAGNFDAEGVPTEPPALNPDLWAQGMPEPVSSDPLQYAPPMDDPDMPVGSSRRRTLVVLAAVLALTAGGLGATFLVRGGTAAATNGEPPTILADTGPAKIQPPDTSNQATGGDGNTALIEKSASDNVNSAKVVNTQERPIDLAQLPKAPDPTPQPDDGRVAVATTSGGGASASAFPEPRKVKTILIRPDGSVIGEDPGQAAAGGSVGAPGGTLPSMAQQADAVPKPATPKSTARASATPKAAATTTDLTPAKPKPAHAAPKAKPASVQTADATPAADPTATTAPPATTGSFAVQLAAPSTEQEAKDISARLQKKFGSELDGRAPTIRKADNKSVYRVRVGNLSQDDAKALCAKLQSSGGSCFVVRN